MISMLADASTRFGVNPKEAERFIKFLLVGAMGFVVDFGVFNLLINPVSAWLLPGHWLYEWLTSLGFSVYFVEHLAPTLAGAISFIAAVSSNFLWNRYWTYPDSRSKSRRRQFVMFLSVSVVGFFIRLPLITFLNPCVQECRRNDSVAGAIRHAYRGQPGAGCGGGRRPVLELLRQSLLDLQRCGLMASRIGFDVTAALAQGGGIGRYTRELIHALLAADNSNQYRLFSARPPAELPVANPLPHAPNASHRPAPLDERWLYRLWYRLRLPLPVQGVTGPLDLFHSPDFVLPPVAGGIPTIVTVHDLSFVHYPHTFVPSLVDYLNAVVPWSIGRATHVLADSESTRDDLRAVWDVPADKITVLYSGVNERFKRVERAR